MRRRDVEPDLFSLRCQECGKPLVRTSERYLACPDGHGRLHDAQEAQPAEGPHEDSLFDCRPDESDLGQV